MNLLRILRRDPKPVTHIGRTWLGHELARINAPIVLLPNLDGLVEFPVGRFTALTRKLASWKAAG